MKQSTPNAPEKQTSFPKNILFAKWQDIGFDHKGQIPLSELPRLWTIIDQTNPPEPLTVECQLLPSDPTELIYRVSGGVWLTCQRCLLPVYYDLSTEYHLALLQDASQIPLIEDETDADDDLETTWTGEDQDFLLLDEVLEQSKLPLVQILEDELLVALPISPKHPDCQAFTQSVGKIPEEKTNPFAVLAQLKAQKSPE